MDKSINKSKTINNYLKTAYDIYSNRFKTVLFLTLSFYIPFYILFFVSDGLATKYIVGTIDIYGITLERARVVSYTIILFLNLIISPIFMASMYILVRENFEKEKIKFSEISRSVLKITPFIVIATIINFLLIVFGSFLIVLAPYFLIIFYFYAFQICEGELNPIKALKKSAVSIKGKFLVTFGIIFLTSILDSLINQIFFSIANYSGAPNNMFYNIFYNIISSVISAYFYIFLALWYRKGILELAQNEV